MKYILIVLFGFLAFFPAFSQNSELETEIVDSTGAPFEVMIDSIFKRLDLAEVTTGLLTDRAFTLVNYKSYAGLLQRQTSRQITEPKNWRHLYGVFLKNAETEGDKFDPAIISGLLKRLDSLIVIGVLQKKDQASVCVDNETLDGLESIYNELQETMANESVKFPNQLPRLRTLFKHTDTLILPFFASKIDYALALNDSNIVNVNNFKYLYYTIYQAAIDTTKRALPDLPKYDQLVNSYTSNGNPIPISLLHFEYNTIREDAIAAGLLSLDGTQLVDVPGRTQSPYLLNTMFAAGPTIGNINPGAVRFILKRELFFTNVSKPIQSIDVDLGMGQGFQEAAWDEPMEAQFADTGEKEIKIRIRYQDCSLVISHFSVDIASGGFSAGRYGVIGDKVWNLQADRAYLGVQAEGQATIAYGCGNNKITKPLIIVKGFEPRQIIELGGDRYNYQGFFRQLRDQNNPLLTDLENGGYDLIFLDYTDGADYIQRNAYLLQTLIERVNREKVGDEPIVILGQSMGGIVARYALADMEKRGLEHNTRLFISFDSPHQGANVPLGFQYMIANFASIKLITNSTLLSYPQG